MTRDWTDFARHELLPGRPRLPEARTAVIGMTDVREAWAALVSRDLVPGPVHEPRGAFRDLASPVEGPRWQPFHDDRTESDEPPLPESVDAAVALACDPRGIAQAGALALTFAAQSLAWAVPSAPRVAATRVAWKVVAADRWYQHYVDRYRMAMIVEELARLTGARLPKLACVRDVHAVLRVTGKNYAQRVATELPPSSPGARRDSVGHRDELRGMGVLSPSESSCRRQCRVGPPIPSLVDDDGRARRVGSRPPSRSSAMTPSTPTSARH